jgi:glycosyltransferase involved in cell wall biosynthesis
MTLRVVQVNCVIDAQRRDPEALLAAWPTMAAIATATQRAGATVTVLQASHAPAEYQRDDVTYRFVPEPRLRRGPGAGILPWRIAAAVRREAPDIVHFNGLDFPFHARAVCELGVPVLMQDHASRVEGRIGRFRRWGHDKVKAAAFTSRAQAEPFVRSGHLPRGIRVVAIPESSSDFTPGDREEARRETGVFGAPALLWVGHLDPNKDPLTIVHAVRNALATLPGLQLWCAFIGTDLLPEVEALLREDEILAAHVHLLGPVTRDRVEALCRACDIFVSASRREGSGYALLEALACGATPVVTDIPAFHALTEGGIGALVPAGDADAFAAAIIATARHLHGGSRAGILAHFKRNLAFDVVGARLVQAYAALARAAVRL